VKIIRSEHSITAGGPRAERCGHAVEGRERAAAAAEADIDRGITIRHPCTCLG